MKSKNVLIICWDFPPHNAIGGRRWAKIAKSLVELDYNVSAVTSYFHNNSDKLSWLSPEVFKKIKLYFFHSHFLVNWLNDYSSPIKKVKMRMAFFVLRLLCKGTIFDKSVLIEKKFLKLVKSVISDNAIQTIFVTGAPFNLLYYTAKLKSEFPELKIIADYRDPWINAQNYGMNNLSLQRRNSELIKQNFVFENVDIITAPNTFLLNEIKETYTGSSQKIAKFIELAHAYDPDDVINTKTYKNETGVTKIVYAGTLYIGLEEYLKFLSESIAYVNKSDKNIDYEISFYTKEMDRNVFFNSEKNVNFFKPIGEKIFEEVLMADYILILLSEHNKNYLTSKFFEFLPYKKPYLYVGPEGYVSNKIITDGLGFHLKSVNDLYEVLKHNEKRSFSTTVDIQKFSFKEVTKNLIKNIE